MSYRRKCTLVPGILDTNGLCSVRESQRVSCKPAIQTLDADAQASPAKAHRGTCMWVPVVVGFVEAGGGAGQVSTTW